MCIYIYDFESAARESQGLSEECRDRRINRPAVEHAVSAFSQEEKPS